MRASVRGRERELARGKRERKGIYEGRKRDIATERWIGREIEVKTGRQRERVRKGDKVRKREREGEK